MDPGRICEAARVCRKLFVSCISSNRHPEYIVSIRSAQGDFNLWCAAIKATSVGKASLDYRLRDYSNVSDIVCNWLSSLKASLEKYEHGTDEVGDDDMPNDQTTSDSSSRAKSPASWDAISDEWSGSDSLKHHDAQPGANLAAAECISYIKTALDRLAWISLAIRKAGSRYRFQRADKALDKSAFADLQVHLTRIILRQFPDVDNASLCTNEIMERTSKYEKLTQVQRRLVCANILRRNRIEFIIKQRGAKGTPAKEGKRRVESRDDDGSNVVRSSSVARSTMSNLSQTSKKQAIASTTTHATVSPTHTVAHTAAHTATDVGSRLNVNAFLSGRTPSTASNLTRVGATQAYPRCPRPGQDRQLQCPYCLDVLPLSYSISEQAWRAHVSQDILPYTCFVEGCGTPDEMYLTSETLLAHLLENHSSLRWICDFCVLSDDDINGFPAERREFCSAEEWEIHIGEAHGDRIKTLGRPELAELAELNERPMIGPLSCPLCDFATPNMSTKIDDHILQHLHEFSLWALPDRLDDEVANGSSESSATAMRSHISGIKAVAPRTEHSLVLSEAELNNFHYDINSSNFMAVGPTAIQFLDWVDGISWESQTTASREFWAAHFGKLRQTVRTIDEAVQNKNTEMASEILQDLASETLDHLVSLQIDRNPHWVSSLTPNQIQQTSRVGLPPVSPYYFIARDEILDDLDIKLFMARPRLQSLGLGDARPKSDGKRGEEGLPTIRSRQKSSREHMQLRLALTGDQGSGKTAIALELAHRIAGDRPDYSIFWVNARNVVSIEESYQHIWASFEKPAGPLVHPIHRLVHFLNWDFRGQWLMILDGIHAQTLQHMVLSNWIPSALCGTILLTTRDRPSLSILGLTESIEVPPILPLQSLEEALLEAAIQSAEPFPGMFLPEGALHNILSPVTIIVELYPDHKRTRSSVNDELVQFILKDAKKLFATCVISRLQHSSLEEAMMIFRQHEISDANLPISRDIITTGRLYSLNWASSQTTQFLSNQWTFLGLTFPQNPQLTPVKVSESAILPFIAVASAGLQRSCCATYRVKVHPSHFDRTDPIHKARCEVAIRVVIIEAGLDIGHESGGLIEMLRLKAEQPEEMTHMIGVKAIFIKAGKIYYMFPWAHGGNLRQSWYFRDVIHPDQIGRSIEDMFKQLLGLAKSLACLHNKGYYHNDLRSKDILIFKRDGQCDTWEFASRGWATPPKHYYLTPVSRRSENRLRKAQQSLDVWSMGCFILELITWLLYDIEEVDRFAQKRRDQGLNEGAFWCFKKTGEQCVHPEVEKHMERMMADPIESEAIKDLLSVVRDKLLVIRPLAEGWVPGYRANARVFRDELAKIIRRGSSNSEYWFLSGSLFRKEDISADSLYDSEEAFH